MLLDVAHLADIVTEAIKAATMPLLSRIAVLEAREAVKGLDGKDGKDAQEPDIEAIARKAAGLVLTPKDGRDGIDADPDVMRAEVAKAVAALPPPTDGRDGKDADVGAVKQWIDAEVERRVVLERALITAVVDAEVAKAINAIERPVNGRDGKDADPAVIQAEVVKAVEAIPRPRDGEQGKDGTSIDPVAVSAMVVELVSKAVEAMPKAVDGQNGKDGIGLAGALIDRDGQLVLTLSDGSTKALGRVIGADIDMVAVAKQINDEVTKWPRPKDGADGLGFEDLSVLHDGERAFTFKFQRGDLVKEFAFSIPVVLYRGVFSEGKAYETGDLVTWAGSTWCARATTTAKPGDGATAWQLAVKAGRDGKAGTSGSQGEKGLSGKDGRDLTNAIDPITGRKW